MTTTTSGRCSDGGTDVARGSAEKKTTFSVGFRRLRVPRDVRNASAGDGCPASHRGHGKRTVKSSGSPPRFSEVSGGPRSPFSAIVWELPGGPGAGASGRRRALPNERKVAFGGEKGKGGKGQKEEDDDEGEYSLQRRRPGQTTTKSPPTRSRIGLRPWGALRRRPRKRATALGSASAQTQKAGYCLGECSGADPESKLICPTATTWPTTTCPQ